MQRIHGQPHQLLEATIPRIIKDGRESAEVNMTKNLEVMKKLSFQDMSQEWHMFNPMTRRMITS